MHHRARISFEHNFAGRKSVSDATWICWWHYYCGRWAGPCLDWESWVLLSSSPDRWLCDWPSRLLLCWGCHNRAFPHKCLSRDFCITQPFPTVMAALLANMKKGYKTVLVRKGTPTDTPPNEHGLQQYHCIVAVYTFQQINEMNVATCHRLGSFAAICCACKSKSHILCNAALSLWPYEKLKPLGWNSGH